MDAKKRCWMLYFAVDVLKMSEVLFYLAEMNCYEAYYFEVCSRCEMLPLKLRRTYIHVIVVKDADCLETFV
jgi:hypothetical protein